MLFTVLFNLFTGIQRLAAPALWKREKEAKKKKKETEKKQTILDISILLQNAFLTLP